MLLPGNRRITAYFFVFDDQFDISASVSAFFVLLLSLGFTNLTLCDVLYPSQNEAHSLR